MLSNKTLLELIKVADKLTHPEINRIVSFFDFPALMPSDKNTVMAKTNKVLTDLRYSKRAGPYTADIQLDFLQYLIDDYFSKHSYQQADDYVAHHSGMETLKFANVFRVLNKELAYSLKRDGYVIEGKTIKKLLPEEIEEAKIESELMADLDVFGFTQSKGHLNQAISNHSQGNWAGANSQFRTFTESLLIEITGKLLPKNIPGTGAQAIKLLSETVNPPFLSKDLNEIPSCEKDDSFVYGLWVRLHPDGSHPGLSDEDDSSFRYYLAIVFANYLLRRLKTR
jgi:hypothetical protein